MAAHKFRTLIVVVVGHTASSSPVLLRSLVVLVGCLWHRIFVGNSCTGSGLRKVSALTHALTFASALCCVLCVCVYVESLCVRVCVRETRTWRDKAHARIISVDYPVFMCYMQGHTQGIHNTLPTIGSFGVRAPYVTQDKTRRTNEQASKRMTDNVDGRRALEQTRANERKAIPPNEVK